MQAPFYKNLEDNPKQVLDLFFSAKTPVLILRILGFDSKSYSYVRYHKLPIYFSFTIRKKSGGERYILSPNTGLKEIQKRLNAILQIAVSYKTCTHGFVKKKSIVTNARMHTKKNFVLNFDLEDFFPSIHFGRVKGLFKSSPFNFNDSVSSFLANVCCFEGILPQGAPTSPVISNLICRSLDNDLLSLCINNKCAYTRYADDITISTALRELPTEIGDFNDDEEFALSADITNVIYKNSFRINSAKTRISKAFQSQTVTGLKVNRNVNVDRIWIKQIRAMLFNWKTKGLLIVQNDLNKYYLKTGASPNKDFVKVLRGKLGFVGMVKGFDNRTYLRLLDIARSLDPNFNIGRELRRYKKHQVVIYTEGKSDWKHLKNALQHFKISGENVHDIKFQEWGDGDSMNNTALEKLCEQACKLIHNKPIMIALFDNDAPDTTKKVTDMNGNWKNWGNNVYSCVLPTPPHRDGVKNLCIEHFYTDEEIKTLDSNNRRLFLSQEFDKRTRRHISDRNLNCTIDKRPNEEYVIIDSGVFNEQGENVALSKDGFAKNILEKNENFSHFDVKYFREIFRKIDEIVLTHQMILSNKE